MNSLERRVENQVQFWSLLGPFLFLMSISVLIFKLSLHWYFPLSIVIGIPLCVKWKIKGMAIALTFLFAVTLFAYPNLNLDERYWHVGMALAMAFSFIILTLSLEEVEGVLTKLQIESKSRLENFLRLDDTTKKAEEGWVEQKAILDNQVASLTNELTIAQKDKEIFYKLAQLAKDELLQIRTQQDLLQQDLTYKKHQISQLNEKLEETEITLQNIIDVDSEEVISKLKEDLKKSKQVEINLKTGLEDFEKVLENIRHINDRSTHERELLEIKFNREKEELVGFKKSLETKLDEVALEKSLLTEAFGNLKNEHEKVSISENSALKLSRNYELQLQELVKVVEASKQVEMVYKEQLEKYEQKSKQIEEEKNDLNDQCNQLRRVEAKYIENKAEFIQEREKLHERTQNLEVQLEEARIEKSLFTEAFENLKNEYEKVSISENSALKLSRNHELQLQELIKVVEASKQVEMVYKERLEKYEQTFKQIEEEKNDLNDQCNHSRRVEAKYIENKAELIQEREKLHERTQNLEVQLEEAQIEKSLLSEALEISKKGQNAIKDSNLELSWQLSANQVQKRESELEIDLLNKMKQDLQSRIVTLDKNHLEVIKELQSRSDEFKESSFKQNETLSQTQESLALAKNQMAGLLKDKEVAEIELKMNKSDELPPLKTSIEVGKRAIECLYFQLKQQFKEKSEVLDKTRQQLFMADERALALQKTLEERELFSTSESEGLLQNAYRNLIQEYEMMQSEYDQELDQLQAIITQQINQSVHIS